MLWSQIKLTTYDFSDLQITGEFDNRPGTGRFLRNFSCVVTYRTAGGRRLYMISSGDARPGTVRCPDGVVRDQPDTVQCPANFAQMKHIFTRNDENNNIKMFAIIPLKKQVVKIRNTDAKTLTVMDVKTTLAQDCKHFNITFSLHVIHP